MARAFEHASEIDSQLSRPLLALSVSVLKLVYAFCEENEEMVSGRKVYRAIYVRRLYWQAARALQRSEYAAVIKGINDVLAVQPGWADDACVLEEQRVLAKKYVRANRKKTLEWFCAEVEKRAGKR